jgi:hypothetical protein
VFSAVLLARALQATSRPRSEPLLVAGPMAGLAWKPRQQTA